MRSKLDYIESRLQTLIENRFTWLPWVNHQPRLAGQITEAFRIQLLDGVLDNQVLPNIIVFCMHAENVIAWQSRTDWLAWLDQALQDTVLEAGAHFMAPLEIRLVADPTLGVDDLRIRAEYQNHNSGSTAALNLKPDTAVNSENKTAERSFLILNGTQFYPLNQPVTNIGRLDSNHIVFEDLRVSRSHAQIRNVRGSWVLFDLNSTGGTFINGNRVAQYVLQPGDVISLAGVQIIYGEENSLEDNRGETTPT